MAKIITISMLAGRKKESQPKPPSTPRETPRIFPPGIKNHDSLRGTGTLSPWIRLFRTRQQLKNYK